MMIEDRFFDQEWVQELPNDDFRMLLYLLHFASKKTGIVELNMRAINFSANTGSKYTKQDVLERFAGMIRMIPGKENTAIFPDYIATNWAKGGRPIDIKNNPLFKSVVQELASYGMTIESVNSLAKKKIVVKCDALTPSQVPCIRTPAQPDRTTARTSADSARVSKSDLERMFAAFWEAYPSCSRKVNRKVVAAKFARILSADPDKQVETFNRIMSGLGKWKDSRDWNKDGGQFICAPLVWLNQERWNADVDCDPTCARSRTEKKVVVKAEDWILCQERCEFCDGARCLRGMKIPPQMRNPPMPPEQCHEFGRRK